MNKKGPIVIIEDDTDDQEMLTEVFKELAYTNEVLFFADGEVALEHLLQTNDHPFLILSDINMPRLGGFALRDMIHTNEQLRLKCIPYLFFTTASDQKAVIEAYSKSIQGFFVKPHSYPEIKTMMKKIVEYWQECMSPNRFS